MNPEYSNEDLALIRGIADKITAGRLIQIRI